MTMRQRRKQFWWTWRFKYAHGVFAGYFHWGVGRINHQHKDVTK